MIKKKKLRVGEVEERRAAPDELVWSDSESGSRTFFITSSSIALHNSSFTGDPFIVHTSDSEPSLLLPLSPAAILSVGMEMIL